MIIAGAVWKILDTNFSRTTKLLGVNMPDYISEADEYYYFESYGSEEELTEDNYIVPQEEDYVSADEVFYEESEIEEIDLSVAKPGLWENIRRKKEREGKNYQAY